METLKYHVYFLPTRQLIPTKGILIFNFWTKASMDMVIKTFVWNWINIIASGSCHTNTKFKSNSFKISLFEQNKDPNNDLKFENVKNIIDD